MVLKNHFDFNCLSLHVLVYYDRSEKIWCALCLDLNLLEDGVTPQRAERNLAKVVSSYLKEAEKRNLSAEEFFSPAPQFFWNLIKGSVVEKVERHPIQFPVPFVSYKTKKSLTRSMFDATASL